MRVGVFAKTFPGTEPQLVLSSVAEAGFESSQWNWTCAGLPSIPENIPDNTCRQVIEASLHCHIAMPAVSGTFNMAHPDPVIRDEGLSRLKRIIETAPRVGASLATLCTGSRNIDDQWAWHPENSRKEAWSDFVETLAGAIEAAEAIGVFLGIEPELANVVSTPRHARTLIDEMQSDIIRIVFDPANLFEVAENVKRKDVISKSVDLLADRISLAHAKDRKLDGSFAPAGKGVIDFTHYLSALKSAGFDGDIIAHGFDANEAVDVSKFLKSILNKGV